jgi:O-antigen/teichoic acid export membrane protein
MTISNIISPLMSSLDRFFLGAYVSIAAVAYYATPLETVTKLMIIPAALTGVIFPAFAERFTHNPGAVRHIYDRSLAFVLISMYPLVLTTIILAPEGLRLWLGNDFANQSTRVLQIIAVGVLANSVAAVPFALIQGCRRPDLTAKFHLAELPLYVTGLWWSVRHFGIDGAALIWTLRVGVDLVVLLAAAKRLLPLTPSQPASARWVVPAALLSLGLAILPVPLALRCVVLLLALLAWGLVTWRWLPPQWQASGIRCIVRPLDILRPGAR